MLGISLSCLALANYAACSISADQLTFGNYNPFNNSNLDAQSNITVSCNKKSSVTVSLSTGSSGTYTNRHMQNSSYNLTYNLFTKSNRHTVWGNGSSNTDTVSSKINKNKSKNFTVYGRIPGLQSIPKGVYTDNIIAEASF